MGISRTAASFDYLKKKRVCLARLRVINVAKDFWILWLLYKKLKQIIDKILERPNGVYSRET